MLSARIRQELLPRIRCRFMKLLLLVFRIKLSWKRIRQVLSKNALLSIQLQTLILQILQRLRQSEIQRKVRCFFGSIKLVLIRLM